METSLTVDLPKTSTACMSTAVAALPKFSAIFHDRESLLASWEAIGPSQLLSNEVQGFLLAYFRHAELHGQHTVRMLAHPEQRPDQFCLATDPIPPTATRKQEGTATWAC